MSRSSTSSGPPEQRVEAFELERPRLRSIAYRMLGTPDDADDVVQEAWLRWAAADTGAIDEPAAWLTTVTTRIAIDRLRSAQRTRETYVGPWLPEPVATDADDPLLRFASAESLTLHFLTVLERLAPVERAVFLLHDVFGHPFEQVAAMVDRSPAAVRQIARRARERVQADRKRFDADPDQAQELAAAFLTAMAMGDVDGLRRLLTDDVVHLSDGGADHHAARRPVLGPDKVSRLLINLAKRADPEGTTLEPVTVNGQLGVLVRVEEAPRFLMVLGIEQGRVSETLVIVNPDKLSKFA